MNRFFLIIILTIFSPFSFSQVEKNTNGFYNCFRMAGTRYSIDHRLLIAIAEVESGMSPKAIGLNKRGGKVVSEDVGLMQINSSWFPTLNSMGITRNDLLENPCQNIYVGAWILAKNISSNGVNWESVGAYNAGFKGANAPFRMKYAKKVYAKYLSLTGQG
ncbi:lytic transglycosylase domain-containing protein [Salmonella enterica subsp. enterica serovar Adelaide]|nr:lytic transglycosylase [Salmonella enterica]ECG8628337.1 lytic transglycosylase domain-containing protein [Salmonella enterica subsp. diarizonae]EDX6465869.1 lytic transglycosylase domain-containing protein [Salmonella enterica subsp. diarizonae serovar 60:r:e,n,x,z15]EHL2077923.1 lytic transglycosylase domain-containing protein [Salmonella enterica subsp. enterica serovar Adelaide]EBD0837707.1 lytic transglycosylase domain-containing protein [Salmonella enterica]